MKCERADIYYFSGTGNTLLVARRIAETLGRHDVTVDLHRIEASKASETTGDGLLGLGFPVAVQGTYPCVWEFLDQLPEGNGRHAFMFDTLMAFSGGIVGPVKKLLLAKGYDPVGAAEIRMPNNIFPKKVDEEKNERIRERDCARPRHSPRTLSRGEHTGDVFPFSRISWACSPAPTGSGR